MRGYAAVVAIAAISLAVLAVTPGVARATSVYGQSIYAFSPAEEYGQRTVAAGELVLHEDNTAWTSARIEWSVARVGTHWAYEYVFYDFEGDAADSNAISHVTLDVTDDAVGDGAFLDPDAVTNFRLNGVLQNPAVVVPVLEGDGITGAVKFDVGAGGDRVVYSFDSNRGPVYGHVFVKDGHGHTVTLWNAGRDNPGSGDIGDFVARPNGILIEQPPAVPEPLTVLGLLAGVGGLGAYLTGRRRSA